VGRRSIIWRAGRAAGRQIRSTNFEIRDKHEGSKLENLDGNRPTLVCVILRRRRRACPEQSRRDLGFDENASSANRETSRSRPRWFTSFTMTRVGGRFSCLEGLQMVPGIGYWLGPGNHGGLPLQDSHTLVLALRLNRWRGMALPGWRVFDLGRGLA
jgi:hypothetical protein